jgi:hypothetical protein
MARKVAGRGLSSKHLSLAKTPRWFEGLWIITRPAVDRDPPRR